MLSFLGSITQYTIQTHQGLKDYHMTLYNYQLTQLMLNIYYIHVCKCHASDIGFILWGFHNNLCD